MPRVLRQAAGVWQQAMRHLLKGFPFTRHRSTGSDYRKAAARDDTHMVSHNMPIEFTSLQLMWFLFWTLPSLCSHIVSNECCQILFLSFEIYSSSLYARWLYLLVVCPCHVFVNCDSVPWHPRGRETTLGTCNRWKYRLPCCPRSRTTHLLRGIRSVCT